MRTLPLTVIACEGPMARAYLTRLAWSGFRVQRILFLVTSHHPATGKPIAPWLPGTVRRWYARQVLRQANLYWPQRILIRQRHLVNAIIRGMEPIEPASGDLVRTMYGPFDYRDYAEAFDVVLADGFRDERFITKLESMAPGALLYTGGGLLPSEVLTIDGIRWLHVHPGHLPDVRGADGLLWSMLLHGKPGASCFYMSPGIDEGNLVSARDFEPLRFDLAGAHRPDDMTLYRALFSFCDPLLRAHLLADQVIRTDTDLLELPSVPQDPATGTTFHFMHPKLREVVLRRLFP